MYRIIRRALCVIVTAALCFMLAGDTLQLTQPPAVNPHPKKTDGVHPSSKLVL
jgi:hypothetical protein